MVELTETSQATETGATRLVEMLARLGVELVFGLPGVHNLPIWKALSGSDIRLVGVRHEQTAAYAADGYARATGRLGVALVTTGPGAANTLGGTGEAMACGSPVLVIATDIPTALRRDGVYRGVLHETRDQTAMFAPVTKATRVVSDAEEIAAAVFECAAMALARADGPVYLGIPTNLLSTAGVVRLRCGSRNPAARGPVPAEIDRAGELLSSAERPLIWAGGGALRADAGPLVGELALQAGRAGDHHLHGSRAAGGQPPVRWSPGPVHARRGRRAVGRGRRGAGDRDRLRRDEYPELADARAAGADQRSTSTRPMRTRATRPIVTLVGDARAVLEQLLPRVQPRATGSPSYSAGWRTIGTAVAAWVEPPTTPQAASLLEIIASALPPEDTVVVTDMCIPGYWLGGYWRVPRPRKLGYPLGWGTLGFGFPASLGACLAGAGPTVCVIGDGGFMYACGELATVVEVARSR